MIGIAGLAEDLAGDLPELIGVTAEEDEPVLAGEQFIGPDEWMLVPQRFWNDILRRVRDDRVLSEGEDRILLRDIDELPLAALLGVPQSAASTPITP